jgi:hypothetical protein
VGYPTGMRDVPHDMRNGPVGYPSHWMDISGMNQWDIPLTKCTSTSMRDIPHDMRNGQMGYPSHQIDIPGMGQWDIPLAKWISH